MEPPRDGNGYSLDWKLYQIEVFSGEGIDSIKTFARNKNNGQMRDLGKAGGNGGQRTLVTIDRNECINQVIV